MKPFDLLIAFIGIAVAFGGFVRFPPFADICLAAHESTSPKDETTEE